MGCDIHLHIEIKVDGIWEHWSAPSVGRNYLLFAIMAGVRNYNEITPVAKPKGLPQDISKLTKMDYNQMAGDAHTASYLDHKEMAKVEAMYKNELPEEDFFSIEHDILRCYLFGNSFTPNNKISEIRFVFWFDN